MAKRLELDDAEIVRLYVDEGLRGAEIARRMGCSDGTVYARLAEVGVRADKRARLDADELVRLYVDGERSMYDIAVEQGVAPQTVRRWLREAGVPIRSHAESHRVQGTRPSPRSLSLRAYMLGFATGDLYVRRINPGGTTIEARCSTTHAEQMAVVQRVFGPFGPVKATAGSVRCSLDPTFDFLLQKYEPLVPTWIVGDRVEAAYAAGYIDAEGSFGVYSGRAQCKVASYDAHVIRWLGEWSERIGVRCVVAKIADRGDARSGGVVFNGDLWRWTVNAAASILRLVASLDPYLQHGRRRAAAERSRANAQERLTLRVL